MAAHVMTKVERMCLHSAARDMHTEFRGIFGEETIEALLLDSYAELASTAYSQPPAPTGNCRLTVPDETRRPRATGRPGTGCGTPGGGWPYDLLQVREVDRLGASCGPPPR